MISLHQAGYGNGVSIERKAPFFLYDLRKLCIEYGIVLMTHPFGERGGQLPDLYAVASGTSFADGHKVLTSNGEWKETGPEVRHAIAISPVEVSDSPYADLEAMVKDHENLIDAATNVYNEHVQKIANKYRVHIATGQMSDMWQVRTFNGRNWKREGEDEHPALDALKDLDAIAIKLRIGPANLMHFKPKKS